jgi:hypothetical protein
LLVLSSFELCTHRFVMLNYALWFSYVCVHVIFIFVSLWCWTKHFSLIMYMFMWSSYCFVDNMCSCLDRWNEHKPV